MCNTSQAKTSARQHIPRMILVMSITPPRNAPSKTLKTTLTLP
ncbi:hypothetical protein ARMA_1410 [Ardenticatena maritima]|uniref:Uncharacterized protein n=1 Tax=Ardenticatena maritima TaxID=872965 RepID=A0A0M8K9E6_9CHLR|nr:hypothetical protein ARMA_1410 [Ardenticatena maritima]